jgi:hypothetical protein
LFFGKKEGFDIARVCSRGYFLK